MGEEKRLFKEAVAKAGAKWDLSWCLEHLFWEQRSRMGQKTLDSFHLKRHLMEALHHNEEAFLEVREAVSQGSWEETQKVLY